MLLISLIVSVGAEAQYFEGTMTWTTKSDIKMSAEQKKQMEESRKAMEKQLNHPAFKKQMEQNPQLKEMMEKQLRTMENMSGEGGGGILPEKMVTMTKGKNTKTIMSETDVILYQGNAGKTFSLNPVKKTYHELPASNTGDEGTKLNVVKTTETAVINGYKCKKYIITSDRSTEMTQFLWATTDIKDIDPAVFQRSGNSKQNWYFKEVEGFPVKMEIKTPQGNISMELTEMKRTKLSDSDFQIPSDYKKV